MLSKRAGYVGDGAGPGEIEFDGIGLGVTIALGAIVGCGGIGLFCPPGALVELGLKPPGDPPTLLHAANTPANASTAKNECFTWRMYPTARRYLQIV